MKYYTWKLKWVIDSETGAAKGIDPTNIINNDHVRVEPQFATGELDNPETLVYVYGIKGDVDLSTLSDWSVLEVTAEETLSAAQTLNPDAIMIDGFITFPIVEDLNN
jgi:hypothetical protein